MSRLTIILALLASATGCVPYSVATTATPIRPGQNASTLVTYAMPKIGRIDSTRHVGETPVSYLAADYEWRMGVDDRSDVGIRIPSMSGIVVNYKRLLSDSTSGVRSAIMPGAGLVNMGQHAHFELTWLISRAEPVSRPGVVGFTPYGGLRVMQVAPVVEDAVSDRPTVGGFIGTRIGSLDLGVSPEIGVFYDHSALGIRENSIVIVPAVSVHGDRLIDLLRGRPWRGSDVDQRGRPAPPAIGRTIPSRPTRVSPPPTHRVPVPMRMPPVRIPGASRIGGI